MTETIDSGNNFDIRVMALEEPDKLTQILIDLEHGVHDPTLTCWTVDDVALDG
jgi:hypothetical protein